MRRSQRQNLTPSLCPIRSRLNEHNKVTFGIAEVGVDAIDDTAFGELNEAIAA